MMVFICEKQWRHTHALKTVKGYQRKQLERRQRKMYQYYSYIIGPILIQKQLQYYE